jgi:hypothetical protein
MWLLSPFVVFVLCGLCSLPSFVPSLFKWLSLSSVCISGAPGSHTTYITHKVGVLAPLMLSCLVLAPLMLSCFRFLTICFFHLLFVLSLSIGTPSEGSQRLACHLHDPRTRHSGFFSPICFVLSIFSSSSIFYLFLSLSIGTPSLGSQRLACHLHDPRTRHSGLLSAICFVLSIFSLSSIF